MNAETLAKTPDITWKELFIVVANRYGFDQAKFLERIYTGMAGAEIIWNEQVLNRPEKLIPIRNSLLMFVIPQFAGNNSSYEDFLDWDS